MKKGKIWWSIIIILIFTAHSASAQISRQQAIDTVMNHIIAIDTATVNVYFANEVMTNEDIIILFNRDTVFCPFDTNYVFFVNDYPFANWEHPCRMLFIDKQSGSHIIAEQTANPSDIIELYTCIKRVQKPIKFQLPPADPDIIINKAKINPHLYAVLIAGALNPENPDDVYRFSNDLANMYCALKETYGYADENIFVHYRDGNWTNENYEADFDNDGIDDIDYDATKDRVTETLENLSGYSNTDPNVPQLAEDAFLTVYVSGHGGKNFNNNSSYISLQSDEYINWVDRFYAVEMYYLMKDINCSQMIFIMNQCYSGGFIPYLSPNNNWLCKKVDVYTASKDDEYGHGELYITSNQFEEFSYYLTAAVRGFYPDIINPSQPYCLVGEFPFEEIPLFWDHDDDYNPDVNNDGYVSLYEAFDYADNFDTWSPYGYHKIYPPFTDSENPQYDGDYLHDVLTLKGYAGLDIQNDYFYYTDLYLIGGTLSGYVEIKDNVTFLFGNEEAKIVSESLSIEDNVVFKAEYPSNKIITNNLTSGQNPQFTGISSRWNIYLNNPLMETTIENGYFDKVWLHNYGQKLTLNSCNFNNCYYLFSHTGDVLINKCDFDDSWIYAENFNQEDGTISITKCNFNSSIEKPAVDIWSYDNYHLADNTIVGYSNGIQIMQSGNGNAGGQFILQNEINNCTSAGIYVYNSYADIFSNTIEDNEYGVKLLGSGNVALGTYEIIDPSTIYQSISNNNSYEVYSSYSTFPKYFRFNKIIDEDNAGNPTDPLVYCNFTGNEDVNYRMDVKYNYWGNSFSASEDLFPANMYWYLPVWTPGAIIDDTEPEDMLLQIGIDYFTDGFYENAKSTFESVIQQYPQSIAAEAAMKELLRLEKYVNDDYEGLRTFYLTNNAISEDSILRCLGDQLANKCNVILQNWDSAVAWYENRILNPVSFEDSLFSIIDLGYTYLLMQNGFKSSHCGQLKEHKPENKNKHVDKRDYLLSLLPAQVKNQTTENMVKPSDADKVILFQNSPNPFSESTFIRFYNSDDSYVKVMLQDVTGKVAKIIYKDFTHAGYHKFTLNAATLTPGIYYLSIFSNEYKVDTKKIVVTN